MFGRFTTSEFRSVDKSVTVGIVLIEFTRVYEAKEFEDDGIVLERLTVNTGEFSAIEGTILVGVATSEFSDITHLTTAKKAITVTIESRHIE